MTHILVIGGYGNFGKVISERLAATEGITVIVAGRSADKAEALAKRLNCEWQCVDLNDGFAQTLADISPDIVIHTAGPFQGQDYEVARACIEQGCHYIDLADDREFVANIGTLDQAAKDKGVLVVTGASSVPCLSAAVMDEYADQFDAVEEIDYGITTAQKSERGLATTRAVLSYVGKPFATLINGRMQEIYGWQGLHREEYPELGKRWLSNCNIPDIAVFPERYPSLKTIRFYAGLEIGIIHVGLWLLSWPVRWFGINGLQKIAKPMLAASNMFDLFGSENSAFHMRLKGGEKTGLFTIIAKNNHGPNIPCIPSIVLAQKIAQQNFAETGATPCIGKISLKEYMGALDGLDIHHAFTIENA